MAYEIPGFSFTLPSNADLSAAQYRFGVCTGGKVAVAGAGVDIIGVIQNKPGGPDIATTIVSDGISKVSAGGVVTAGNKVMSNGSGQAITATPTNRAIGIALQSSTGSGQLIAVLLKDFGTQ